LNEKVQGDLYFDAHFYKLSVYSKLQSLLTQMVIDILLGLIMLLIVQAYTQEILSILHYFGQFLHIEVLERQVKYLMHLPAGFKPNPNLDNFIGNFILDIISVWNYVTTELTGIEYILTRSIALSGFFGVSVLLAIVHDYLFLASFHVFIIYTLFSAFYKFILQMTGTLFRVFKGVKYNILRKRDDKNYFQIQELYLGVLIITLIIFLTPTIAMYYYMCFIFIMVTILIDQILLLNLQNLACNLPLYLLIKSIFAPYSLPNSYTLAIRGD
jgi:phosphatidylinositol glycan class Q protein